MSIKLTDCNGKNTDLLENELLVFIDETGHELLKDKKYPIFGLGGICVLAKDYNELVKKPWIELKKQYFKGLNSLHEIRIFEENQIHILNYFFKKFQFCRIGCAVNNKTILNDEISIYTTVGSGLINRILNVAQYQDIKGISIIFESSTRGNKLALNCFSNFDSISSAENGKDIGKVSKYFMHKSSYEPGLEVAHFVVHTYGRQLRKGLINPKTLFNEDYKSVFLEVDPRLVSLMTIKKVSG